MKEYLGENLYLTLEKGGIFLLIQERGVLGPSEKIYFGRETAKKLFLLLKETLNKYKKRET